MTKKRSSDQPYGHVQPLDRLIVIEWIDACQQEGPISRTELAGTYRLVTAGLLIREDEHTISLCMDYVPIDDQFRDVRNIIKANVVKRTEYRYPAATVIES